MMIIIVDDVWGVGLGLVFDVDKVLLFIGRKFFKDVWFDKIKVGVFKVLVMFFGKVISYLGLSSVDGNIVMWIDIKILY